MLGLYFSVFKGGGVHIHYLIDPSTRYPIFLSGFYLVLPIPKLHLGRGNLERSNVAVHTMYFKVTQAVPERLLSYIGERVVQHVEVSLYWMCIKKNIQGHI